MEVDCPALSRYAGVDAFIEPLSVENTGVGTLYLHTSPEYRMKQLLCRGSGDIFQISHVYRSEELGRLHQIEFTMVEWYRVGFGFQEMIDESIEYATLFLGRRPWVQLTYREAFIEHVGFDPFEISDEELYSRYREEYDEHDRDCLLNYVMGVHICPKLGFDGFCVITHYPSSQCALARCIELEGNNTALRFELFYQGTELANGYYELLDSEEQLIRFQAINRERIANGKAELPIDYSLIESLKLGMPACCGVAVGFDRLMMLRHESHAIDEVIPFPLYPVGENNG